ncbi:hypothetical protein RA307_05510 [Xanthobacteraceae bacterium Astr-EGSB]|uniref:hypothetical protein n=1 Tax=Astrobacterium formosum TaxID=3069710 RepID=UPI0027B68017|nr:hypothetical protein [Xanthobacteraceae bacterium Astr-EGSB]
MRIVDIRETAVPLKCELRNSIFDFSEMTMSVVAVVTDVVRDGRPVTGFASLPDSRMMRWSRTA